LREKRIRGEIRTVFSWCWRERFHELSKVLLEGWKLRILE